MTRSNDAMTPNLLRRGPLIGLMVMVGLAILFGCESPEEPRYVNPLDPRNPESTDPFGLGAVHADGWVTLEWTVPEGPAIAQIVIESIVAGQPSDIDTVAADVTSYIDTSPRGNTENQYRLRAEDGSGRAAQNSQVVTATVFVPPVIAIPGQQRLESGIQIRSAVHDVVVGATTGDVVQLDTLETFAAARTVAVVDDEATFEDYRILAARVEGADNVLPTRDLYARVGLIDEPDTLWVSDTGSVPVTINLATGFGKLGGGNTVAAPVVDVSLLGEGAGMDSVRFATSEAALAAASWRPGAGEFLGIPLRDTPGPQELWVEYLTEFGFDTVPEPIELRGDDLSGASFDLVLPESGIVEGRTVGVEPSAVATEMRLSTSVGFEGAPWQAYADSLGLVLGDEPGPQTIYAQFRNHWFVSPILAQEVLLSAATLDVAFDTPVAGDPVRGGSTVDVSGHVTGLDAGYTVTGIEVNVGEGWQDLPADTLWSTTWTVPDEFAVDTPWLLGARATAADTESGDEIQGVSWIEVTITQLGIAITSPAEGDTVATGAPVTIRGTATQDLTADPLESVEVTVADTVMTTTEALTGWQVSWNAAAVDDTTTTSIVATVRAGEESLADTVSVVLIPPEPEEEEEN
ncbi:hypothetical protein GF314_10545 [bacterium]|nr:hypothetical protein [bacterium]